MLLTTVFSNQSCLISFNYAIGSFFYFKNPLTSNDINMVWWRTRSQVWFYNKASKSAFIVERQWENLEASVKGSKFSVSWRSGDKARSMGYKTLPSSACLIRLRTMIFGSGDHRMSIYITGWVLRALVRWWWGYWESRIIDWKEWRSIGTYMC
jgi:hypothetical protein